MPTSCECLVPPQVACPDLATQGGLDNVVSMFLYIAKERFGLATADVKVWAACGTACAMRPRYAHPACLAMQGWPRSAISPALFLYNQTDNSTPLNPNHPPQPGEVIETPATGCLHPAYRGYFSSPAEYMRWYEREGPVRDPKAPTGEQEGACAWLDRHTVDDAAGRICST